MPVKKSQQLFSGGEISPALHNNTGLEKYHKALKICRNFIVNKTGGISNRPGTKFVDSIVDSSKVSRLIPFEFNVEQTYALEFSDLKFRVIKDGAYVLETSRNISGATQSFPCVITTSAAHFYANGDDVLIKDIAGMTELNNRRFIVWGVTANTFQLLDVHTVSFVNSTGYGAYVSGGTTEKYYTVTSPYAEADLPLLKITQSADVMTITHADYQIHELSRLAHDNWTIAVSVLGPELTMGTAIKDIQPTALVVSTTITNIIPHPLGYAWAQVSFAGPVPPVGYSYCWIENVVGMTEVNKREFLVNYVGGTILSLIGEDVSGYAAYISGGNIHYQATGYKYKVVGVDAQGKRTKAEESAIVIGQNPMLVWSFMLLRFNIQAGIEFYDIYRKDPGGFYGYIGTTEDETFKDENIVPDFTDSADREDDVFDAVDKYPGAAVYHEQRLMFGRSNDKRQAFWGTRIGDYANMDVSFPVVGSDAFEFELANLKVNEIRHLFPGADLLLFTSGGVHRVNGGGDSAIAPNSILVRKQSDIGSSEVPPLGAGDSILYVEDSGDAIHDLTYTDEGGRYAGVDLSIFAEHLFIDEDGEVETIKEWAYAKKPDSVVWIVTSKGNLLGLTYLRDENVWAWHRHDTSGTYESIVSIRENNEDAVYVIVKRARGKFVERLSRRITKDVRDAFFVDSGLSLDIPISINTINKTDPAVVNSTSHGLSNGDYVDLSDIIAGAVAGGTSMETLNNRQYKIQNVSTNTFTLTDTDDVDISTVGFDDYGSGGLIRKAESSVSGLSHLDGETVAVLANGNVIEDLVVADGVLTLPAGTYASRLHVGMGYISDIETLAIDTIDGRFTGKKINVTDMIVGLYKSRGLFVGPDADHLVEWKQRGLAGETLDEATKLFTGKASLGVKARWKDDGTVFIRQSFPLPIKITALIPTVGSGG